MTVVETRMSVWEALAGRAPGQPVAPADAGLWGAVVERLNPARARPVLRPGIEYVELVSVRGLPYVMLRSPDDRGGACYLRLTPQEWQLAQLMDGSRTVARLVAEFARIAGRLAPDQVTRVVADLAGNRMLAELPVDVFRPLDRVHRRPWPVRLGRTLLAVAQGRRTVLANVDPLIGALYRGGGRFLFTRVAAVLLAVVGLAGFAAFCWTWWRGEQAVFLTNGSYVAGAAVLLGLNVVALACHELGHALATRHAGRRVPAAGFLVYFGIPSVFVDTTDVWMAGRRSRLITTAAGPAAGLVLAGIAGIVGLLFPAAAPWTFKLAFAWYLNALFNLNPFLALDGYYLLMDWLEIPNLRARGLAYVTGRLRRRGPRWAALDREGRLVALYGMLAVLWVVIAVNLFWRIWTDRVAGLVTGLWRSGWPARLLLAAVVAGLAAPLVYLVLGWLARRWRRLRARLAQRRHASDTPRRLDALRASALRTLPASALNRLAAQARWVHPRTGEQLVAAGAAQPAVFVVVDGAVEGRAPGDPVGTVRQRLGPGGLVGLASALTGTPAALTWHTAGTTLLTLPPAAVATVVGPLPGPPPADRIAAESLLAETPALSGLTPEDRLGLVSRARQVSLPPGSPVRLSGPYDAVVLESGVIALMDGTELRRGTMIGPVGAEPPDVVATTRTPVRLWQLPAVAGLPMLLGAAPSQVVADDAAAVRGGPPASGAHPPADYPPLAAPPGPPPLGVDDQVDSRFERRLWWLVLLLLLFALLITGGNLMPGPAWAEMPADRALLRAERGTVEVHTAEGRTVLLRDGAAAYVADGDRIEVRDRSTGELVFRGGAASVLCAGSQAQIGALWSSGTRPVAPSGELVLDRGRILADTASTSGAFRPLALTVGSGSAVLANRGEAWFAVNSGSVRVSTGEVRRNGVTQRATGEQLGCGDGYAVTPPGGTPSAPVPEETLPESPTVQSPSPDLSATRQPVPTPLPSPSVSQLPVPGLLPTPPAPSPTPGPTAPPVSPDPPTSPPPTSEPPPTTAPPTSEPPPTTSPPPPLLVIFWAEQPRGEIGQDVNGNPCGGPNSTVASAAVTVQGDTEGVSILLSWSDYAEGSTQMSLDGDTFYGAVGPVRYDSKPNEGGSLTVRAVATDRNGRTSAPLQSTVQVAGCQATGPATNVS
ncbi:cyclic nucleotide-binding protein [Micromonospora sp. NBC_01813]|uniref:cyclic nucleotide-binding protein n=1 Tax=Micromonospora sp. NBC_01813 TaxID=2975988 RepID=UPI002DDA38AF|nr:cyclic nucleotide-binding protein [Micromonospora sp. NBC_01813]WSA12204.1 cyclic nucleotide-binding protein [Micromonospora sp. NBC_01813]